MPILDYLVTDEFWAEVGKAYVHYFMHDLPKEIDRKVKNCIKKQYNTLINKIK